MCPDSNQYNVFTDLRLVTQSYRGDGDDGADRLHSAVSADGSASEERCTPSTTPHRGPPLHMTQIIRWLVLSSWLPPIARARTLLRDVLDAAGLRRHARRFSDYGVASSARFGTPHDTALDLLELTREDLAAIGLLTPADIDRFEAARSSVLAARYGDGGGADHNHPRMMTTNAISRSWLVDKIRRRLHHRGNESGSPTLSPLEALLRAARLGSMQEGRASEPPRSLDAS